MVGRVAAQEAPVVAAEDNEADVAFHLAVIQGQASVFEEAAQGDVLAAGVGDGPAQGRLSGHVRGHCVSRSKNSSQSGRLCTGCRLRSASEENCACWAWRSTAYSFCTSESTVPPRVSPATWACS